MQTNEEILKERLEKFNHTRIGPRVGDYLYIPSTDDRIPEYTRFTHEWDDTIQTGGNAGSSYYLNANGKLSYSGGLDPGMKKSDLICTGIYKDGSVWIFDKDIPGAGRGITFMSDMMIYTPYYGADISGVYSRNCPYYLITLDEAAHNKTCGYWFTVTRYSTAHTAFRSEKDLLDWLQTTKLSLTKELTPWILSGQSLKYNTEK